MKTLSPGAGSLFVLVACLSSVCGGCSALAAFSEVLGSAVTDENAKRQDDPAAYRACDSAYSVCKQNGLQSSTCKSERDALISENIYCGKIGVFSGKRGAP